jgi:hypothetical protein
MDLDAVPCGGSRTWAAALDPEGIRPASFVFDIAEFWMFRVAETCPTDVDETCLM